MIDDEDDFESLDGEPAVKGPDGILRKLVRCSEDDPNRCQAVGKSGQCPYKAVEGAVNCHRHKGESQVRAKEAKRVHDYRLQVWQNRMTEFAASDKVVSLAGEIGILRLILEETLNRCTDSHDLVLMSTRISGICTQIEKLVVSFDKMSTKSANLLTKGAALSMAGQIVDIISSHVTDSAAIDKISNSIIDMIARLAGKEVSDG